MPVTATFPATKRTFFATKHAPVTSLAPAMSQGLLLQRFWPLQWSLLPVQRHKSCPRTILVPVQPHKSCPRTILVITCSTSQILSQNDPGTRSTPQTLPWIDPGTCSTSLIPPWNDHGPVPHHKSHPITILDAVTGVAGATGRVCKATRRCNRLYIHSHIHNLCLC